LDDTEQERERGVTIDVAQAYFETPTKGVTVLDAPGHKDFLPNAIMGVAEADAAVLVVDATKGEFETGFGRGGQTREHAVVARSLGIQHLIVAINKMDTVGWDQSRFDEIREALLRFLLSVGFKAERVHFVPTAGYHGHNITDAPPPECNAAWYTGPGLVACVDALPTRAVELDLPLRVTVSNVFKAAMGVGTSVCGRIVQGSVQVGEGIVSMPSRANGMVKVVAVGNEPRLWAVAGDSVVLTVTGTDRGQIGVGSIVCSELYPITTAATFEAQIVTFDMDVPITKGHSVLVYFHQRAIPATVKKLLSIVDKRTREPIAHKPRFVKGNAAALVRIQTDQIVCVEAFAENKFFGRFIVRYGGSTVAAGIVTKILG
jgi:elongation factor 1 alpha-like protein